MRLSQKNDSPQKISDANNITLNKQYLFLIKKNKLQLQSEQSPSTKLREVKSSLSISPVDHLFDDSNNYINLNTDRVPNHNQRAEYTTNKMFLSDGLLNRNYKTIDEEPSSNTKKYLNLGSVMIANNRRQQTENISPKNQNKINNNWNQLKVQHENLINDYRKDITKKLLSQVRKKQGYQSEMNNSNSNNKKLLRDDINNNSNKAGSGEVFTNNQNESTLLIKKEKIRELWREKFMYWNQAGKDNKKKINNDLRFPNISTTKNYPSQNNVNNYYNKSTTRKQDSFQQKRKNISFNLEYELNDCSLIRNSRPKLKKNTHTREVYGYNKSMQMGSQVIADQDKMKKVQIDLLSKQKYNKLTLWETDIIIKEQENKTQIHNKSRQFYKDTEGNLGQSTLNECNPSGAILQRSKKRKQNINITQLNYAVDGGHNLIQIHCSQSLRKRSKKNEEIIKQKQKDVETYLKQNTILKTAKIINHYEKNHNKKKLLFEQMQKNYYAITHNQKIIKSSQNQQKIEDQKVLKSKGILPLTIIQQKQQTQAENSKDLPANETPFAEVLIISNKQPLSNTQIQQQRKKTNNINSFKKDNDLSIYEIKIRSYFQFIFMMNLAHKVFTMITPKPATEAKNASKFTYFIGKGNNRLLIKSLMNRRYWWEETKEITKANFVWTQLKNNQLYKYERIAEYARVQNRFDKLDECCEATEKKQTKKKMTKATLKAGYYKAPLPDNHQLKIFTKSDNEIYQKIMCNLPENTQNTIAINFINRLKYIASDKFNTALNSQALNEQKVHNHLQFNYFIGNKKALFYNLQNYYKILGKDVFQIIPYTLHIKKGVQDIAYKTFLKEYNKIAKQKISNGLKNIWIVKPGELSNRGQGITVIDEVYQLNNILKKKQKHNSGLQKSYILQKYIQKPLLFKNRKFDIRHYVLLTRFHGRFRAYFYGQGYIRTSSHEFKLDQLDEMIHLTNDAIQKEGKSYGKHQDGNKVSYTQFQRYLDSTFGENKYSFAQQIYPKMKSIALDSIKATYAQLDPCRLQHNFQLLGLDFMIDNKFNVWLIEVNTNPCLELSSKLLQRIIPQMTENVLRLCIDPLFPPPAHYPNSLKHMCPDSPLERLQYELIFDEARDGKEVEQVFKNCKLKHLYREMGEVDQEDATFENDGNQIQLKNQKGEQNE